MTELSSGFAQMPLQAQLDALVDALRREPPQGLLERCAALRDHAPLAWLCQQLLEQGWFGEQAHRVWFAGFFLERSETAIHRVLQAWTETMHQRPEAGGDLCALLVLVLERIPFVQMTSMCALDRALKHHFPEARERALSGRVAACEALLREGALEVLDFDALVQLPAESYERLAEVAAQAGVAEEWNQKRRALAHAAIGLLGDVPKALSLSNAEELLARRVYTDPGHFLLELLQNAEDTGASTWRVEFAPHQIVVWHDGLVFDARDLVGVTSIGQTTKRKQQIGFFGVGFKSIYEVTSNPQIYSDVYQFEIAEVSIPKVLSSRPRGLPEGGTLLVLPLRDPDDAARSPQALYKKARALDPCVLLTLRSLQRIALVDATGEGEPQRILLAREEASVQRGVSIRQEPEGWRRSYLLQDGTYTYARAREAGRPDATRILLGVLLDDEGVPKRLEEEAPTIYSYLPTAEYSGLRFFVHGHFDVPLDRERIAPDSAWNAWILAQVPTLLARLATGLFEGSDGSQECRRAALALLEILPLGRELGAAHYHEMASTLPKVLGEVPLLPCSDGQLHKASETLCAPDSLVSLFEGGRVDARLLGESTPRSLYLLEPGLSDRAQELARFLGCRRLTTQALLGGLEAGLAGVSDGASADVPWLPGFLSQGAPEGFEKLYDVLLTELEALGREDHPAASAYWERLRRLPLVLDETGRLFRGAGITRGAEGLRAIYRGLCPLVHPHFENEEAHFEDAYKEDATHKTSRSSHFLKVLGVARLDLEHLVSSLEGQLRMLPVPLEGLGGTRIPQTEARLQLIFGELANASLALQRRVAALPLFRATDGRRYPVAQRPDDPKGVLALDDTEVSARLASFYGGRRPLVMRDDDEGLIFPILRALNAPTLTFETLVLDLEKRPALLELDTTRLFALHALLSACSDEISPRTRQLLAPLAIWPDQDGTWRPLLGRDAVVLPFHEELCALFPGVPFLHEALREHRHLAGLEIEKFSVLSVLQALGADAREPRKLRVTPQNAAQLLRFLLTHCGRMDLQDTAWFATLPLFLDDRGEIRALESLCVAKETEVRGFYAHFSARAFLAPDGLGMQLLQKLGLEHHLEPADSTTLVAELHAFLVTTDAAAFSWSREKSFVRALCRFVADKAPTLTSRTLTQFLALPLFADQDGRLGPLGDSRVWLGDHLVYPCEEEVRPFFEASSRRVLDAGLQSLLAPVLTLTKLPCVDLQALIELLSTLPRVEAGAEAEVSALQTPEMLTRLQAFLQKSRVALAKDFPPTPRGALPPANPTLCALQLWQTRSGAIVCAQEVIDSDELEVLFAGDKEATAALKRKTLAEKSAGHLRGLAPLVAPCPPKPWLLSLIQQVARPGRELEHQVVCLSRVGKIEALLRYLVQEPDTPERGRASLLLQVARFPFVDASGCLRLGPLKHASPEVTRLLAGLPLAREVLHPALDSLPTPLKEVLPELSPVAFVRAFLWEGLTPQRLEDHPILKQRSHRENLYQWLSVHQDDFLYDAHCRELLEASPLFPSAQGRLLRPGELVIDPTLPDLGIDWHPHAEIPDEVLALLERYFGAGRPPLEELVTRHLRPAYLEALRRKDAVRAARLLRALAERLQDHPREPLRALLCGDDEAFLLEDDEGRFVRPQALLLPSEEVARYVEQLWPEGGYSRPSRERYGEELDDFFVRLGVAREPSFFRIQEVMQGPSLRKRAAVALAGLLRVLYRKHQEELLSALSLVERAWLPDRKGRLRRADALFVQTPDLTELLGDAPALFLEEEVADALGERLCDALPLKTARQVVLDDVVQHLDACVEARAPVPLRVYRWLEQGAREGWLSPKALHVQLARRQWVYTDDESFYPPYKVLQTSALRLFGNYRGYWTWGARHCPTLCRLFEIPTEATPRTIEAFLRELGTRLVVAGTETLLAEQPALPRMLLACFAALGGRANNISRSLPLIPSRKALREGQSPRLPGPEGGDEGIVLLPADTAGLYRSNTPTLEKLFCDADNLRIAMTGYDEADRSKIEQFLDAMGVPLLGESYTIALDATAAQRQTQVEDGAQVLALRSLFRALLTALPRLAQHRSAIPRAHWVYEERLRHLASVGPIHAIDGLRVAYQLPHVGSASVETLAIYDLRQSVYLIDTRLLASPLSDTMQLAASLLPCICEGGVGEGLADLIELLLPLQSAARMHAYLDRRHFPQTRTERSQRERLIDRISEVFDYGLHRKLAARFGLQATTLERWRTRDFLDEISETKGAQESTRDLALQMLAAIELQEPPEELLDALEALLQAPSLDALPGELLSTGQPTTETPPLVAPQANDAQALQYHPMSPLQELEEHTLAQLANAPWAAPETSTGGSIWPQAVQLPSGPQVSTPLSIEPPRGNPEAPGMWQRLSNWLGLDAHTTPQARPPQASVGDNVFAQQGGIPDQLWATQQTRQELASSPTHARLHFDPQVLPAPYAYMIHAIGATFVPTTQRWSSQGMPPVPWSQHIELSGRSVMFEGQLAPGESLLPVPLYGSIAQPPMLLGPPEQATLHVSTGVLGQQAFLVRSQRPLTIRYEVALHEMPNLTELAAPWPGSDALRTPTIRREALPLTVQQWLHQQRRTPCAPWEHAVAARHFVRNFYRYDDAFLSRPEVREAKSRLRPQRGNHHLELLHASADGHTLGRGVCYELNIMLLELLRHLGIPSLAATGWLLDQGWVARPDHLFALALLPSPSGVFPFPLDAAGRGDASSETQDKPAFAQPSKIWSGFQANAQPLTELLHAIKATERQQVAQESASLLRLITLYCRRQGRPLPPQVQTIQDGLELQPAQKTAILRQTANALLGSPGAVGMMLQVLQEEHVRFARLPSSVQELEKLGLVEIQTSPVHVVSSREQ